MYMIYKKKESKLSWYHAYRIDDIVQFIIP